MEEPYWSSNTTDESSESLFEVTGYPMTGDVPILNRKGKELCLPRGSQYYPGEMLDPMLRTVSLTITSPNYYCQGYRKHETPVRRGMFCTGMAREEHPTFPCLAVPGAPLVVRGKLAAILSWGFGCGYQNDLPLVYTDTKYYIK
ncbi:unnamed protein product [Danaus chrysippus]|uniref:(African queen) hypothetical protein n=1 Tax=Danaus chrysippus TaxID=151541 RepID=A0A8J2Q5K4_9NEOP|nr:unnamed protein product [Danaus chrysippus]